MKLRDALAQVAADRDVPLDAAWSTLDDLVPLLDSVLAEEGVVIMTASAPSGRRAETSILGGRLGHTRVVVDGDTIVEATARALVSYAMSASGAPRGLERAAPISTSWSRFADVDALLLPLVEDGVGVTLKMDGQRRSGWFDVIVTGGKLGEISRRTSGETLLDAARRARETYANADGAGRPRG